MAIPFRNAPARALIVFALLLPASLPYRSARAARAAGLPSAATAVGAAATWRAAPARRAASTIYVDASNSSAIEDGTAAHPYNTIQEGLGAASSGNIVSVAAGIYFERITLKSGVSVVGAGAAVTQIDGTGQNDSVVTASSDGPGTALDGFTIKHGTGKWVGGYTYGAGLYVISSTVVLRNCLVVDNHATDGAGGLQATASTIQVDHCTFKDNTGWWGGAVTISGSTAEIQHTVVDHNSFGYGGAVFISGQTQLTVTNSLVMHTPGGPAVGIGDAHADLINDTIVDNGGSGVETGSYITGGSVGTANITNTVLWANHGDLVNVSAAYSDIQDGDAGPGNLSGYPQFVLPSLSEYGLRSDSPCIDAGTNQGAPDTDIDGDPRPIDGNGDGTATVDIGADEFDPAHPPTASAVFLPVLARPQPEIFGRITFNGAPVSGVTVDLRFYDGSTWSTRAQAATDFTGKYTFTGIPGLAAGQAYYVRYLNNTDPSRLFTWHTQALTSYAAGDAAQIGNFDIADINLTQPPPGAKIALPYTFQWDRRPASPSDSYQFELFDPYGSADFLSPLLGYVPSYTLTGLPGGFGTGPLYGWAINVYSTDGGYGLSYYYNPVRFQNRGSASAPLTAPNSTASRLSFDDRLPRRPAP